jgi:PAS domain-containing protein
MKLKLSNSVQTNLILIIMAAVLPIFVLILMTGRELRQKELQSAEEESRRLCRTYAAQQESITQGVKQLLSTLAEIEYVQELNTKASTALFQNLLKINSQYGNIVLLDINGFVVVSAKPYSAGHNISHLKHVIDAKATDSLAVGEYQVGTLSNVPVISFAYPVHNQSGSLVGILATSLKLSLYYDLFKLTDMPPGTAFGVLDHKGVRLAQFPVNEKTKVGNPIQRIGWTEYSKPSIEGHSHHEGLDGVRRQYFSRQLRLTPDGPPYMVFTVGVPDTHINAKADAITTKYLFLLAIASIASLFTAYMVGNRGFVVPLRILTDSANKIENGSLDARTGLDGMSGPIGSVAKAFDNMAQKLQEQEAARVQTEMVLRNSKEQLHIIADNTYDWEYWRSPEGRLIWVSPSCEKVTGYPPDAFTSDRLI